MFQLLGPLTEMVLLRQTGILMAMHGCGRPGLVCRASTRSALTPPPFQHQPSETEQLTTADYITPEIGLKS